MRSLSPGNKARAVGLLGAIFSYAMKRKLVAINPVRGIQKPTDVKRTRRLSEAEYVFASLGADMGLSDNSIASLLGHAHQSITSRYLHLGDKAAIENANLVANETIRLMNV
jgi:site-specific recombinase XerD